MDKHFSSFMCLFLMALPAMAWTAETDLRTSLFGETDAALGEAREIHADLLAPRSYGRAIEAYRSAEQRLQRGQSLDRIRSDIASAKQHLDKANDQAKTVSTLFSAALAARSDAKSSDADKVARGLFQRADESLRKVAADLERGRSRNMQKINQQLASGYRAAELAAIKHRYLADTRELLAEADALRADRYAPRTLAQARALLAEADQALSEDRYDADRPRALAKQANYQAKHSIYLARQFAAIRDERLILEALVLEWEQALAGIAAAGDLAVRFDEGPAPVAEATINYLRGLQAEIAGLNADLSDRGQQIAQMELEIHDLEQRLGGVARERSALEEELARQAQVRQRFLQVEGLFEPQEEAQVIREADKVTLRLVGLTFDVGESTINTDNFPLLAKVESAIRIFPRPRLVVEGHTDSFGSDEKNMQLSQDRAEAVRQYLLANMRLNPGQISAVGHGEEKPIANNETPEGRARNRRIDLIILPENDSR